MGRLWGMWPVKPEVAQHNSQTLLGRRRKLFPIEAL